MEKPEFESYTRPNEHNEFEEFYQRLPIKDREKLSAVMLRTQSYGIQIAIHQKWVKKLPDGFFELRSSVAGNIQRAIYFHAQGSRYIVTHGFTKKTKKTPQTEIKLAAVIRSEFESEERQ